MRMVLVVCPSPSCPGRVIEGESVTRETWNATWHGSFHGPLADQVYWGSDISCPCCGTEGIDPESGQLDSAEEELGRRCELCGVVSSEDRWPSVEMFGALSAYCPECGKLNVAKAPA
jgi:hypothetical protein